MKNKAVKLLILIFMFCACVLLSNDDSFNNHVNASTTYTGSFNFTPEGNTPGKDYYSFWPRMRAYNYNESTKWNSLTVYITDQSGERLSLYDENDAVIGNEYTFGHTGDHDGYIFGDDSYFRMTPNVTYTVHVSLDSDYEYEIYEGEYQAENGIQIAGFERMIIRKKWDDGQGSKRPTPEEYKNTIIVKENGQVADTQINFIRQYKDSDDDITFYDYYEYEVLGINIKNNISVEEKNIPNYELSEVDYMPFSNTLFDSWYTNSSRATLTNKEYNYFDILLYKVDKQNQNIKLANAEFTLTNTSNKKVMLKDGTVIEPRGVVGTIITDENGYGEFLDLPSYGTYLVEETKAPPGYKNNGYNVTLNYSMAVVVDGRENKAVRLTGIRNEKNDYGGIKAYKYDYNSFMIPLEGAKFNLMNRSGKTIYLKDGTAVEDNGIIGTYTSGPDGYFETGLILPTDGRYEFVEIEAPENYVLPADSPYPRIIRVEKDRVYETDFGNGRDAFRFYIIKSIMGAEPDTDAIFEFEVTLKDKDGNPYNGKFHYHDGNGQIDDYREYYHDADNDKPYIEFVDGIGKVSTKHRKTITVFDVPNGFTYEIRELPHDDYYCGNCAIDGKVEAREFFGESTFYNIEYPDSDKYDLTVTKELVGKDLEDGQFTFELVDEDDNVIATAVNDAKGDVVFKDLEIEKDKLEKVKITYGQANQDQKDSIEEWYKFFVGNNPNVYSKNIPGESYVNYYQTPYELQYKDATDEYKRNYALSPYNSWLFNRGKSGQIVYYDMNYLTPDNDYFAYIFEGEFNYRIREVIPENSNEYEYDDHEENITVKVTTAGNKITAEVIYDNEERVFTNYSNETSIKISKVDMNGKSLSGAKIEIRNKDGNVIYRYTSDNKPKEITITPGEYIFHEVSAPNGYQTVTDIHFSVDEEGKITVEKVDGVVELIDNVLTITDKKKPNKYEPPKTGD